MNKTASIVLAFVMATLMLAGCSNAGVSSPASVDACKTIGELRALGNETEQSAYYDDVYVYVFEKDGTYYRASAALSEETSSALWDLDILADDYDAKYDELINPLEITDLEELNNQILIESDLAALVGKTGQELLDDGWSSGYGYNLETMEFWMDYGPFSYTVIFDGEVAEDAYEDFDDEEGIKDFTVKSITFLSLGNNATDIEMD